MTNKTFNVINTLQASGADCTLSNHKLKITGAPEMDFREIEQSEGLLVSLAEGLQSWTITPTASDSKRYSFEITQINKNTGTCVKETISYVSLSTGETATTICNAFRSLIALKTNLKITTSGTSTLILTGQAGYPMFDVKITTPIYLSVAASQVQKSVSGITNAAPRVATTSTAHGWSTGQKVVIAGTATTVIDGTYRITVLTTTTFQLDGTTASGAVTGTITADEVAQQSRGQYSDLVARGITGGVSGNSYSTLELVYKLEGKGDNATIQKSSNKHTVYIKDNDVTNAAYVALADDIADNLGAVGDDGTTADPEAVAIA